MFVPAGSSVDDIIKTAMGFHPFADEKQKASF
jgi:hypothetical protein